MVIEVGKLSGNAIVPYSQTTQKTSWIDISPTGLNKVGSGTGSPTIQDATIKFFNDENGQWFIDFNIGGTVSATTSITATLTDITTNNITNSFPLVSMPSDATGYRAWLSPNDNTITQQSNGSATNLRVANGSPIPIQSLPSYALPYLEASTNASAYIEPASATKAGLVESKDSSSTNPSGTLAGTTISNESLEIRRIEDIVVLTLFLTVDGSSSGSTISLVGAVPAGLRPTLYQVNNLSTASTGNLFIDEIAVSTAGNISIFRRDWDGASKAFIAGNYSYTVTYLAVQ